MKKPAKKSAKTSRNNLDLDLDARLDQATSTLSLDEEPPVGDKLDHVLAKAKKELDADVLPIIPETENRVHFDDLEGLLDAHELNETGKIDPVITDSSLAMLDNQLTAAMESTIASDEDLDNLFGNSGFDFDSLLGDASDELTPDQEAKLNEDSLLAAVDDLLNFGVFGDEIIEPETNTNDDLVEFEISLNESDVHKEIDDHKEIELTVEPEAALDDLVDSVPFEEGLTTKAEESKIDDILTEEFNDFDDVADIAATLVEISTSVESLNDDLDGFQQLDGLNDAMENKNDTPAGFDLIDDDALEKQATPKSKSDDDDSDWMTELDNLDKIDAESENDLDWEEWKKLEDSDTKSELNDILKTIKPMNADKIDELLHDLDLTELDDINDSIKSDKIDELFDDLDLAQLEKIKADFDDDDIDEPVKPIKADKIDELLDDLDLAKLEDIKADFDEDDIDDDESVKPIKADKIDELLDDLDLAKLEDIKADFDEDDIDDDESVKPIKADKIDELLDDLDLAKLEDIKADFDEDDIDEPIKPIKADKIDELLDDLDLAKLEDIKADFDEDEIEESTKPVKLDKIDEEIDDMDLTQLENIKKADVEDDEIDEPVKPVKLDKIDEEPVDDQPDWMKQLEAAKMPVDDDEEPEEPTKPVKLDKIDEEPADEEPDWMKQLEAAKMPVDDDESEPEQPAKPVKVDKIDEEPADEQPDWMKQLEAAKLPADEDEDEEPSKPAKLDKIDELPEDDETDWMKQLEAARIPEDDDDAVIEEPQNTTKPVKLDKVDDESADDDDWMKQLDGMEDTEEHDEDTAGLLMEAGHELEDDEAKYNIADDDAEEPKPAKSTKSGSIDEDALIAKAAEVALSQMKDEQEEALSQLRDDNDHTLSQLRADQDSIESRTRKQLADAENGRKKTAIFGYVALGVGIIGLIGSAGIGWLSYGTKNDAATLSESVIALDEKVNSIITKDTEKSKEITSIKTSVEQLSQKVDQIAAAQIAPPVVVTTDGTKTAVKTTSPVDLLNSKTTATTTEGTSPMVETAKVAESNGSITEHKTVEPKLSEMVKKPADVPKPKAVAKTTEVDKADAKAESELFTQKMTKIADVAKAAAANPKTEEQRKLLSDTQASRYTGRMTRGMAQEKQATMKSAKVESTKSVAKKEILKAEVKSPKAAPVGKYSVNVVSYQQEWFAQSKAAEFKQKGIPVEVVPVDASNHATRFRLKVGGFKNKNEAAAYAKSHGINESWVGSND